MSSMLQRLDEPGDAELISAVRGGDVDAYGELFNRHVEAARRLGRQLVSAGDVDDLVSEAFTKVLVVLQRGGGPDLAFRAYLLTAVRRLHVDKIRATARLHTTDDLTPFDPGVPFRDTAVEGFENAAAARAFASLPERWQLVLWHTEVEGQKPAEIAPLLGMSANSVSALAYRAREGLRQAFLGMHVQEVDDDACAWTHRNLGAYIRKGISRRDANRVEEHLAGCRSCTAIYLELTEVNSNLSGILAPVLLGGAAAAYVGGGVTAVATKGGLLLLLGRARDLVVAHLPASAAAGVAVAVVVSGGVFVGMRDDPTPPPTSAAPSPSAPASPGDASGPPGGGATGSNDDGQPGRDARTDDPRVAGGQETQLPGSVGQLDDLDTTSVPSTPAPGAPQPDPPLNSPAPTTHPGPQPGADVHLAADASEQGKGTYAVSLTVSGLGGDGATLRISGEGLAALVTTDSRCDLLGLGSGACSVPAATTTYDFKAVAPAGATLVFTVASTGDGDDPDPSDNRVVVPLG